MKNKVVRLVGTGYWKRLSFRKYQVKCQVSERWIQFPKEAHGTGNGDYISLNVMTQVYEGKPHKICELVVTRQDLQKMLDNIKTI
jgi:hypothetical protein